VAYQPFPIKTVELKELRLDLENYRIPDPPADEITALEYLYKSEGVLDLAKSILRYGYLDNEVPMVMPRGDNDDGYTVLEGNRRIAALKGLINPSSVPSYERDLSVLVTRYAEEAQDLPNSIRVLIFPDRSSALPHIARLHTGLSKKAWSRDQQARFYYSLFEQGKTIEEIKARYPGKDIPRYIRMAMMRRFLVAVPFMDESLRDHVQSGRLKMSIIERAFQQRDIAEAIGVAFDEDGFLLPKESTPEEIASQLPAARFRALELLVKEIRDRKLNTRSPEFRASGPAHDEFVARLRDLGQDEKPIGDGDRGLSSVQEVTGGRIGTAPTNVSGHSHAAESRQDGSVGRGPNHPHTKKALDLSGLDYDSVPVNLKVRYFELRRINIEEFPLATAMLLRSVLESTIKFHFEKSGNPVSGSLDRVLPEVRKKYGNIRWLRSAIERAQSGLNEPGSKSWFNLISHSADAVVKAEHVREAWAQLNPLIRHLLRPTDSPS